MLFKNYANTTTQQITIFRIRMQERKWWRFFTASRCPQKILFVWLQSFNKGWFFGHSVEGQRVAPLVFIHKKFLKGGRHFPFHPQLYLHNIWQRMFCKTWIHFRESYPAHFITSRQIWKWRTLFHCSNSRHGPRLTWRKKYFHQQVSKKGDPDY